MPLVHTLGYHFCKWANVSAEILMDRTRNFTDHGFPIDVLWSDIEWAMKDSEEGNYRYFVFNEQNFTDHQIHKMNKEIEEDGRRITVIVDPHIKVADDYFVYAEGEEMQYANDTNNVTNIFIREGSESAKPFFGDCWPGNSTWIDFLNENA
jgi:alpha 1,3-glucosidase